VLTSTPPHLRRGASLAELIVALSLGAMVLGTATSSLLRQQRAARRVGAIAAGELQLAAVSALVPAEVAGLAAAAGDLAPAEARDSAMQLRAPIVAGLACDSSATPVTLSVSDADDLARSGMASIPHAGDTLWWYASDGASWLARRIIDVRSVDASCRLTGRGPGPALRIMLAGSDTIPTGALIRVTRQRRYVIYKSGDGSWQLGLREWSEATRQFAPPQPLAGPLARRLASGERSGFRYFDASDAELVAGGAGVDVGRVARIRITALALSRSPGAAADSLRRDSVDVALEHARAP
jgi:hypothetical protein